MTAGQDPTSQISLLRELVSHAATLAGALEFAQIVARPATPPVTPGITSDYIEIILRLRRRRDRIFGDELFADPAWDMLLDLALSEREGRAVSVSSLCLASAVPPTTALRWISKMSGRGLLERTPDVHDGRRTLVRLSEQANAKLAVCLEEAVQYSALI